VHEWFSLCVIGPVKNIMSGIPCTVMDKGVSLPKVDGHKVTHMRTSSWKCRQNQDLESDRYKRGWYQVWGALRHYYTGRSHEGCKSSEFRSPGKIQTQWKMANVSDSHDGRCQWLRQTHYINNEQTLSENKWPGSIRFVLVLKYTLNFTNLCLYCRFHRLGFW